MIRALVMVLVRLLLHRQKQGAFAAACVSIPCCLVHANFSTPSYSSLHKYRYKRGFPTLRYGSLGSAISSQLAGVMT